MRRRRGFIMVKHHPHGGHSGNSRVIFSRMLNKRASAGEFESSNASGTARAAAQIRQRCFAQTDGETDFVSGQPRSSLWARGDHFGIMNGVFGIELATMSKESMLEQIAYFATAWCRRSRRSSSFSGFGCELRDRQSRTARPELFFLHPNKIAWAAHMEKKIPSAADRLKQLLTDRWENGFKQSQPVWGLHRLGGVGRLVDFHTG